MGMTQERSQQIGRAIMAFAGFQLLFYVVGITRRSYVALALPIGVVVAATSGLAFWVGYTMATTNWDNPADYPPED